MVISAEPYELITFKVVQTDAGAFAVEQTTRLDLPFEGDTGLFYAQEVNMKYFVMTMMPLETGAFKSCPTLAIYRARETTLAFSQKFPEHHFGYTAKDYLECTF